MRARLAAPLVLVFACGTPTRPPDVPPTSQYATASFVFHYTQADAAAVGAIAARVEEQSPRIVADLGATGLRPVRVYFYETHAALAAAVRPAAGTIPSWATALVTAADQIHMLSPSRAAQTVDGAVVTLLHEFAHCVTLHIAPQSANNPRWLWETIALYEARQAVDPRTLPYVLTGQVPSLSALSDIANTQIYDLGYVLGEFVVSLGGVEALRLLAISRGDVNATFGFDQPTFEARWREYIRTRYGV